METDQKSPQEALPESPKDEQITYETPVYWKNCRTFDEYYSNCNYEGYSSWSNT